MEIWFKRGKLKLKGSRFFSSRIGAKRVFYSGCTLPGADSDFCLQRYGKLLEQDPNLGLWFECCATSFCLRKDHQVAERTEQALLWSMLDAGLEEVVTACGNCYEQLNRFSGEKLQISRTYARLHGICFAVCLL